MDKNTTPIPFVFSFPSDVQAFVDDAVASANSSNAQQITMTVDLSFVVTQNNCMLPSGKYGNHIRYMDETGITFISSPKILYTAPETFWRSGGECNTGQMTIGE